MPRTLVKKPTIGTLELHGVYAALLAGAVLLFAEMLLAALFGGGFITPLRYAASIVMHDHAFVALPLVPMIAGVAVHVSACAVFGFLYGLIASVETPRTRRQWSKQILLGAFFGLAIWGINFQIIARVGYPWFLGTVQLLQMVLHIVAFGVPMAIIYAYLRRRPMAEPSLRSAHVSSHAMR